MTRYFFIGMVCIYLFCPPALAHDFWLQPQHFKVDEPHNMPIGFKVGHHYHSDDWDLQTSRVVSILHHQSKGEDDLSESLIPKTMMTPGLVTADLSKPGTHLISFESNHSVSTLSADKFNDYAENEGLLAIIAKRQADGLMQTPGIEIYSRRAKALIQVGDEFTDTALQTIGHTLEIVPLQHPYSLTEDNPLAVKVLFQGKPLVNATVDLMSLDGQDDDASKQARVVKTNSQGIASFNLPRHGNWIFNVVWGVPSQKHVNAEFETFFASMTLGFE